MLFRSPRTVSLLLAGSAMAISGLVMQQISQNRFVEPTTTGTTEWAGLGLLCVLILYPEAPLMVKMVAAIAVAFGGTMVFFLVLRRIQLRSAMIVPIVGIMLGAVVGAVSSYFVLFFGVMVLIEWIDDDGLIPSEGGSFFRNRSVYGGGGGGVGK